MSTTSFSAKSVELFQNPLNIYMGNKKLLLMVDNTNSVGILRRGTVVYYVGSAIFAAGIALLAAGVAFAMIQRIHYGSEPWEILLFFVFTGVGGTLILAGINMMMKQTRYGYYIIAASVFVSFFALLIFARNYPYNWHYPLVSYVIALYTAGFLLLVGNAFANVILWMISGKPEAVGLRGEEIKAYTDEEIERDIEEATRKSIELSAGELKFRDLDVEGVKFGKAFRETRGDTIRIKDNMEEAKSLEEAIKPGGKIKSGSVEVDKISMQLGEAMRKGAVEKGRFETFKAVVTGRIGSFIRLTQLKK